MPEAKFLGMKGLVRPNGLASARRCGNKEDDGAFSATTAKLADVAHEPIKRHDENKRWAEKRGGHPFVVQTPRG